jgi:hypothetical protein
MAARKAYAWLGIAVGVVGLLIDFWIIMGSPPVNVDGKPVDRNILGQFVYFWSFFTHLSNLGLVLVYCSELSATRWLNWVRHPVGRGSMAGLITLVMVYFHIALAPIYHFTGGLLVANYMLHYVAPILYLIWWVWLNPHGTLRFRDLPQMLAPGIVYLVLVLIRGAIVSDYPYAIIDPAKGGYGQVAIGVTILLAAVAVFCAILVAVDGLLARLRRPAV